MGGITAAAPEFPHRQDSIKPGVEIKALFYNNDLHEILVSGVEAIVPLDNAAGRSVGARAQLLLFLQDLIPSVFGKPLLSR